jgi:hypothetical protein
MNLKSDRVVYPQNAWRTRSTAGNNSRPTVEEGGDPPPRLEHASIGLKHAAALTNCPLPFPP